MKRYSEKSNLTTVYFRPCTITPHCRTGNGRNHRIGATDFLLPLTLLGISVHHIPKRRLLCNKVARRTYIHVDNYLIDTAHAISTATPIHSRLNGSSCIPYSSPTHRSEYEGIFTTEATFTKSALSGPQLNPCEKAGSSGARSPYLRQVPRSCRHKPID